VPYLNESSLQHYPGRVEVTIQHSLAPSADKGEDAERNRIQCPTDATLLGRIRRENLDMMTLNLVGNAG